MSTRPSAPSDRPAPVRDAATESSTRSRVQQVISEEGPVNAATIAATIGLTPTAVRRHLEALEAAGLIVEHAGASGARGRGRPARSYVLSAAGHEALDDAHDDIATSALRYLSQQVGEHAVEDFAHQHLAGVERRLRRRVQAVGEDPGERARALAEALSQEGYAATSRPLTLADGSTTLGVQLCQGHCPVQHVANEFPQLCDAEQQVFSRLLGVHVQRLATLAHGEHVCTTFVPTGATSASPPGGPPPAGTTSSTAPTTDPDERSAP